MRSSFLPFVIQGISLLGVILLGFPSAVKGDDDTVRKIVESWRERRDQVRSLRARTVEEVLVPKGANSGFAGLPPGPIPPADYRYENSMTVVLDFEANRFRKETRGQTFQIDLGRFRPRYKVVNFDGIRVSAFFPKEEQTGDGYTPPPTDVDAAIGRADLSGPLIYFGHEELPLFLSCGIVNRAPDARKLQASIDPGQLHEHGRAVFNDRPCVVLRSAVEPTAAKGFDELWVDVERGAAILRWRTYWGDYLANEVDCTYEQRELGWVPVRWRVVRYFPKGGVDKAGTITLRDWQINSAIDVNEFTLPLKPGMLVRDDEKGLDRHVVEPDGRFTRVSVDGDRIIRQSSWTGILIPLLLGAVFVAVTLWGVRTYVLRRRHQAIQRP